MNIYDMTRAYYAYIARKQNKTNCIIALKYNTFEHVHTIMDALFFDGAYILDYGIKEVDQCDGMIDCDTLTFVGVEVSILEDIVNNGQFEHQNNATCQKM